VKVVTGTKIRKATHYQFLLDLVLYTLVKCCTKMVFYLILLNDEYYLS